MFALSHLLAKSQISIVNPDQFLANTHLSLVTSVKRTFPKQISTLQPIVGSSSFCTSPSHASEARGACHSSRTHHLEGWFLKQLGCLNALPKSIKTYQTSGSQDADGWQIAIPSQNFPHRILHPSIPFKHKKTQGYLECPVCESVQLTPLF